MLENLNLFFGAEHRLFQRDLEIVPETGAALPSRTISSPAHPGTKNLVEDSTPTATVGTHSEHLSENVKWVVEPAAISTRGPGRPADSCMPVTIISRAFVLVHQHFVRFAELFKLLFGARVARIFIRMILNRE